MTESLRDHPTTVGPEFDIDLHCAHCRGYVPEGDGVLVAAISDEDGILHGGCADEFREARWSGQAEFERAVDEFEDWFAATYGADAPYSMAHGDWTRATTPPGA